MYVHWKHFASNLQLEMKNVEIVQIECWDFMFLYGKSIQIGRCLSKRYLSNIGVEFWHISYDVESFIPTWNIDSFHNYETLSINSPSRYITQTISSNVINMKTNAHFDGRTTSRQNKYKFNWHADEKHNYVIKTWIIPLCNCRLRIISERHEQGDMRA